MSGFKQNTISDEEHRTRSLELIKRLEAHEYTQHNIKELFFLYNDRMTPRENGSGCGSCRNRVFNRLKQYYKDVI